MANTLPSASGGCCPPSCDEVTSIQVPGAQGDPGDDGADGADGVSPFTTFTAAFTIPAELATAVATVADTSWMVISQKLYGSRVDGSVHAFLEVVTIGGATSVTLRNLEDTASSMYVENSAPASTLNIGSKLIPAGIQGPTVSPSGAAGGDLKSTYPNPKIGIGNTKGSSLWGNGIDTVAVAAGSDGFLLAYDSTDAEGIKNFKALPVTGDTNVSTQRLVRLSATTGFPIPVQSTKAVLNEPGVAAGEKGALVLDVSSGNARGIDAVDLQVVRAAAGNVAAGTRSVVCGGQNNRTASDDSVIVGGESNASLGARCFVGGGDTNSADSTDSVVVGGTGNAATQQSSAVVGGESNTASGQHAFVGGGSGNTAGNSYSFIPGGLQASANLHGQYAHAAGAFASAGDAQVCEYVMRVATTDATPTELLLNGSSERLTIPASKSLFFQIRLIARTSAGLDAIYTSEGVIRNNAGTTSASSITTTEVFDGASLPVTPVVVSADNGNDALIITVTGIAATNIRWVAMVRTVEILF